MLKFLGGVLIISATSLAGLGFAQGLEERRRLLLQWIAILELIKTAIGYQTELLPEVFARIASTVEEAGLIKVFKQAANDLRYGTDHQVAEVWQELIHQPEFKGLRPVDVRELQELGMYLGSTDQQDQLAKISNCQERLKFHLNQAEADLQKNAGLARYLGFASGAVLVLLLA